MASAERHVASTLLTFFRSASPEGPSNLRPLSHRVILGVAFAIGIFICFVSAVANAFLLSIGVPAANLLMKVNAAGGVVAILLIWKLLRWSRERNSLIRQRDRVIEGLNHKVRNAIHVMYMETYNPRCERREVIKQNVIRIDQALRDYVPMSAEVMRHCPAFGRSTKPSRHRM